MENTQSQPQVAAEPAIGQQADESQARQTPPTQLGRLLANPRRVRRS